MQPRNQRITDYTGLVIFRFEMIAKDCDIHPKEFLSWGLNPSEGKRHILFITEPISRIDKLIYRLNENEVDFTYSDITKSVLKMRNVDPLLLRAYNYNEIFKSCIDKIRLSHLDYDDVLDKINESGLESLDEVDLTVLKNV